MRTPEFWYPQEGRVTITSAFLSPLAWIYDGVGWMKGKTSNAHKLRVPVVCVGNLTAGGAGKTPCCIKISEIATEIGMNPSFVSRGYGGSERGPLMVDPGQHTSSEVGDEPLLLSGAAKTWIATDRAKGGDAAQDTGATTIVMDDGFQNPSLYKTLSILVVDGRLGFGNRRVIPAGPLRENISRGLGRADAIIVMGGRSLLPQKDRQDIEKCTAPVFDARLEPDEIVPSVAQNEKSDGEPQFIAFAGIGRPQKFFDTLKSISLNVIKEVPYPDHHPYSSRDTEWLLQLAHEKQGRLITTAKDHVRLSRAMRDQVSVLPVSVAFDDEASFRQFLKLNLLPHTSGAQGQG